MILEIHLLNSIEKMERSQGWSYYLWTFLKLNLLYFLSLLEYLVTDSNIRSLSSGSHWYKILEGFRASNQFVKLVPHFKRNPPLVVILKKIIYLNGAILLNFILLEYFIVPFLEDNFQGSIFQLLFWIGGVIYKVYHYPFLLVALILNR